MYDTLAGIDNVVYIPANEIQMLLQWHHNDPRKRKYLNKILCCDFNEGPEIYLAQQWFSLRKDQQEAILKYGKMSADAIMGEAMEHNSMPTIDREKLLAISELFYK
jgi:hypothetical protein